MEKIKSLKITLSLGLLILIFLFSCSCGSEAVQPSLNYEHPVLTMVRAVDAMDSKAYFNCFTESAKQAYSKSDSYNPELVRTMLPSQAASKRLIKAKIVSNEELEKDKISELEQQYKEKYKKRIKISKAQQLSVEIGTIQGNSEQIDTRDLTVVLVENNWLIYGDVIEKFNFEKKQA